MKEEEAKNILMNGRKFFDAISKLLKID